MNTSTTASKPGIMSDFFGSVRGIAQDALYTLSNDILPNWTKTQIETQLKDQLDQDTYNREAALPRVETITLQEPVWLDKNYSGPVTQDVTGRYLAIGLIAIIGVAVLRGII